MRDPLSVLPKLWSNVITLLGSSITTVTALGILVLAVLDLATGDMDRYASAFLLVSLPALFVLGLLLIPVGLWWERRRKNVPPDPIMASFTEALKDRHARRRMLFLVVATLANVVILAVAGEKAMSHMDSPVFCGTTCHQVMEPEWVAYNRSPHGRVHCVECHIGPGAAWLVKAKIDGLRQVWGVMTNDYHRPIPTPVETLRPSRDTCERCHWPARFSGARVKVFPHFGDEETNPPAFNIMALRVGGANPKTGAQEGIHWHVNPDVQVRYQYTDEKRQKISHISVVERGEVVAEYQAKDVTGTPHAERIMDCVDCHNRPTHVMDGAPQRAVDAALYSGMLDAKVPFLRAVAVAVLSQPGATRENTAAYFKDAVKAAYAKDHPEVPLAPELLAATAEGLATLFKRNVFPAMNVTWNTYPTNLGHDYPNNEGGCFRCHDDSHEPVKLAPGRKPRLDQDCETCHSALAQDSDPATLEESLRTLVPLGH